MGSAAAARLLLDRLLPSRPVSDPEFVVEGIKPKREGPFTRVVFDQLVYVNFTQIFRGRHGSDPEAAKRDLEERLLLALNWGRQSRGGEFGPVYRLTAGLAFLEEFVGAPIDPAFCRLAVLRPFETRYVEAAIPPDADVEKARELGLELRRSPAYHECLFECGLDVVPAFRAR